MSGDLGCFEARYLRVTRRNRTEEREGEGPLHSKPQSQAPSACLFRMPRLTLHLQLKVEYSPHHEAASAAVAAERTQTLAAQLTARF